MQMRIYKDGKQRGPYSEAEVARFIHNGAYNKHDLGFTLVELVVVISVS